MVNGQSNTTTEKFHGKYTLDLCNMVIEQKQVSQKY
jgi:hypothetical protein